MPDQAIAAGQLRAFIERIERLEEEKSTITDDIKEVYAEAKGNSFDTKAIRTIIRLRKRDLAERQEEEAILDLYMAALGMADVEKLLSKIAQGRARPRKENPKTKRRRPLAKSRPTPIRANRVGEVLRKMFNLATKPPKMRDDNPAAGFRKRIETERERFLSPAEIGRLATALGEAEDQRAATIIRLCLLTGARLGEVRCARFDQFNLDFLSWSKPAATTKQRKIHRLPISEDVAAIVCQRRLAVDKECPWLFPGDVEGQPVQDIRRFWRGIQKSAELPDVRIHDLRHTFASLLVSGGASLEMIGKLLGHTQHRTTQRYAHLVDAPLRAGVNNVADLVKPCLRVVGGVG